MGALADGTRLAIVARLADGPWAVGQLAAGLPVSRSAVSQYLKILKDAGLVEDVAAPDLPARPGRAGGVAGSARHILAAGLAGYAQAAEAPDEEG